ncbi:hypothetical protein Q75_15290 [Bacillus coahuilensis p1.1.43]|uniref:Uncharacterized protein n=1 Tax=Bacillus coahuilensis p1.1.43 TaxID=1150625 RepID=A0A147K4T0_9BACI|nr:DUF6470 family protein [Bacillus coahuilensis]KUP04465.1 hypothetical protein Q75_15290 [Bacillus coahuilensis p1.1.43]
MLQPQIRMQSQPALIQLNIQQPVQSIEQPGPTLDIQQPAPVLRIETTPGTLTIDQTRAWEAMNRKSINKMADEAADRGYEQWLKYLGKKASEGTEMLKGFAKGQKNMIQLQAKRNSESPKFEFRLGWIPPHGSVDINISRSQVDIFFETYQPINNTKVVGPDLAYQPGTTQVTMKQYQDLQIDFVNLKYKGFGFETEI